MVKPLRQLLIVLALLHLIAFQNCSVSPSAQDTTVVSKIENPNQLESNGEPYEGKLASLNIQRTLPYFDLRVIEQNGWGQFQRINERKYCSVDGEREREILELQSGRWSYSGSQCSAGRRSIVEVEWSPLLYELAVFDMKVYQSQITDKNSRAISYCLGRWQDYDVALQVLSNSKYPELPKDRTSEANFYLKQLPTGITYSRTDSISGAASYYDSAGKITYAEPNQMRFNHNPATGEFLGLLIEGRTTNWAPFSQELDQHSALPWQGNKWQAPDKTVSADVVSLAALPKYARLAGIDTSAIAHSSPYTLSFYIKASESSAGDVELSWRQTRPTGTIYPTATLSLGAEIHATARGFHQYRLTPLREGWYRLELSMWNEWINLSELMIRPMKATGEISIWGLQLEERQFATSYIKTVDSQAATRGADDVEWKIGAEMSRESGSYLFEWDIYNVVSGKDQHMIVGSNKANSVIVEKENNGSFMFFVKGRRVVDSVEIRPGVPLRSAVSFSPSEIHGSHNGSLQSNFEQQTIPVSPDDRFQIGHDNLDPDTYLYGHIRRITYWNQGLKPAQLADMTSDQRLNSPLSAIVRMADMSRKNEILETTLISLRSSEMGPRHRIDSSVYNFNLSTTDSEALLKTQIGSHQVDTNLKCVQDR